MIANDASDKSWGIYESLKGSGDTWTDRTFKTASHPVSINGMRCMLVVSTDNSANPLRETHMVIGGSINHSTADARFEPVIIVPQINDWQSSFAFVGTTGASNSLHSVDLLAIDYIG